MPLDLEPVLDLQPVEAALDLQPVEQSHPRFTPNPEAGAVEAIVRDIPLRTSQPIAPEQPGRITKQPETLGEWTKFMVGGALHPIKQLETLTEQAMKSAGVSSPNLGQPRLRMSELMEQPAVLLPHAPEGTSPTSKIASGVQNAVIDFAQFFLTPEGVMSMGIGSLAEPVRKAVMLDFAGQMATSAPQQFDAAYNSAKRGDLQGAVQQAASGTAASLLSGVLAKHGAFGTTEAGPTIAPIETIAPKTTEAAKEVVAPEVKPDVAPEVLPKEQLAETTVPAEPVAESKDTGIKNVVVDQEREARGQEPILGPQRLSNKVVWDRAMSKIDADPTWQDRLIEEFQTKPRTPSAEEVVALDHRYVDLQNEYSKAVEEGTKAKEAGNEAAVEEAKTKTGFYEGKLNELEQVTKAIGTEWGRSGQMRQRLMKEDYSLASMEARTRAAKGFEPLTPEEHDQIADLHRRLQAAEEAATETEKRITLLEAQKSLAEAQAHAKPSPRIVAAAERFANYMDTKSDAAKIRLREKLSHVSAGIDPTILSDVAIVGAGKIARGAAELTAWTNEMAADVGEWIRDHADEIWKESKRVFNTDFATQHKDLPESTSDKILRKLTGHGPTTPLSPEAAKARAEVQLLRDEFQRQLEKQRYRQLSTGQKVWRGTKEALNLSRAVMTSWDVSAVLRQGGFIAIGNPIRAARSLGPMFRALASNKQAAAIEAQIQARPNANLYAQSGLYISPREGGPLTGMEEAFMSRLASRIPGVAGSARAYTTFLNKLRADSFDALYDDIVSKREATPEDLKAISNFINIATGRGNLGKAAGAAETLSTVFFAPRLVASRFQLLAGEPLYRGTPRTRYLIAKEYAKFLTGIGVIYGLASMAGAEIESDPRSSEFGKLRFGNTRIDPLSGLSQVTVLGSRLATGETKTGRGLIEPIRGKVKYGHSTSADVIATFLRTKLSPAIGTGVDVATGKNVVGEPVTAGSVAKNLVTPLAFQDIYDVMTEQGVEAGTAIALLSLFGMNVQNYDSRAKRK